MDKRSLFTSIPKVDEILENKDVRSLQNSIPRTLITESIRKVLGSIREYISKSSESELKDYSIDMDTIVKMVMDMALRNNRNHLRKVINASGVIIHTNLGRSILSKEAVEAVTDIARNYSNLEYDLEEGKRGSRYSHVEDILTRITKAEAALVVNNNAAAVLLILSTLCKGKEAIVSRGELVEIGGSFRIPEVMEQSGAKLVEVGATNRTHLYDYERAINENTGALLKVHTSNYRILGFTEFVSGKELVDLGRRCNIPVIEDIGSGSFIDFSKYGLSYEPTVQEAVGFGIDIVAFSGDKMLGGPQAGIIVGKKKYIDMMKKNPLTRALRVDKMTLSALEVTLKQYIEEEKALENIPTVRMIVMTKEELRVKAESLHEILKPCVKDKGEIGITEEYSQIGGGSMPLENIFTYGVFIKSYNISANKLEEMLRHYEIPIIARVWKDSVLFDVRTIDSEDFSVIKEALDKIF